MRILSSRRNRRFKNSSRPVLFRAEPLETRTLLSVVTLNASADTFVQEGSTSANFGTSTNTCALPLSGNGCLVVLNSTTLNLSRITYLKFNLSGITDTINSATMRLVGTVADPRTETRNDDVFGVPDASWIESGAGYMTYATRKVLDPTVLDTQAISGSIKPYTWNVLNWVSAHPNQQVSLAVVMSTAGAQRHFYRSIEFGTDADRPKLILSVGVPDRPSTLTATPGNGQITLNWPAVDANTYSVYRGTAAGQEQLVIGGLTTNSFVDTTVANGQDYFYYIVATNGSGDSLPSNEVGPVRPTVSPAPAPTPITVIEGVGSITLSWDPVTFADSYNVYRSDVSGGPFVLQPAPAGTTFTDTVAPGAKFYYKVASVNSAGEGPLSPEIVATAGIIGTGTGISATYYDNIDFTGPSVSRVDPTIDFDWEVCCNRETDPTLPLNGSPDPSILPETFSSRYIGDVQAVFTQPYTFYTTSDDGVRLWINDVLVIDKWILQGATEWASQPVNLVAGQKYHVRLDFFENFGAASTFLRWSSPSTPKEIVPTTQLHPYDGVPRLAAAPSVLRADAIDVTQVCVRWTDVAYDEDSFILQRSTKADFSVNVTNVSLPATPNIGACIDQVGTPLAGLNRSVNSTTATTSSPHGLTAGSTVTITGATASSFNGTFVIASVPTPTTFTFVNPGPSESASVPGNYVSRLWYRIAAVNAVGTSAFTYSDPAGVLPSGTPVVNYASFPADTTGLSLVSLPIPNPPPGAALANNRLRLVPAANDAVGAAWLSNVKIIDSFTANFDFQVSASNGADGFTFTIQGNSPQAIGGGGGALGFAGMPNSVGIKFDFYPNLNHSGVYVNGAMNDTIGTALNTGTNVAPFGIDFDGLAGNGVIYHVDVAYDGTTLLYTITDTTDRTKTVSIHNTVDIAGTVGSHCAYVGFTAANGGLHATQEILNFNFTPGVPVVNGTTAPDTFYVRLDSPGGSHVHVWKNHDPAVDPPDVDMTKASINNLALTGGQGTDTFTLDFTNGNPLPAGGLLIDGGQSNDTLIVKGTDAAESFTINGTDITVPGGGTFRHTGLNFASFNLGNNTASDPDDSLTVAASIGFSPVLNGGGGNNTITVNAGTYNSTADDLTGNNDGAGNATLNIVVNGTTILNSSSSQHLKSLTLNDTSKAVFVPGGNKLLRTRGLTIAAGAALDIGDGDVILQSTSGNKMADWNTLMALLRSGRNGGLWNGLGVRSASAAANARHATGVGIILNDNGSGAPILTTFNGEAVDANTVLLKYTYYGDRDFDGDIDADDYAALDASFANRSNPNNLTFPRQPWREGDPNLSNSVNSDDFFLVDNAFSNQPTVLSAPATPMAAASASTTVARAKHEEAAVKAKHKTRKASHHRTFLFRVRD
ncbi:MAG TPA: PA14 domain-containing protein [Tepidisphaeraceae bacterium]|jgi:hypothetical protein|nr:PA14 domain-containing protein [Tepidisphaeraceae bacterium]